MKSISINSINITALKFTGFFVGAVALCIVIVSSFWTPSPVQSLQENTTTNPDPDKTYGQPLTTAVPVKKIVQEEDLSISGMLDSIKESKNVVDGQMKTLQKELDRKNALLVKLQNQLKSRPVQTGVEEATSSKQTKKMKNEIEFLKWALRSEVSSNHALTNSNRQLKMANASLNSQLNGK